MSRNTRKSRRSFRFFLQIILLSGALALTACSGDTGEPEPAAAPEDDDGKVTMLSIPELEAAELDGRQLRVVATTDVIGDVVAEVGSDQINLVTLMAPGQDPHSYEPSTGDLAAVANADVIFVNGWGLEESLLKTVERTAEHGPLVPISAGVMPLSTGSKRAPEDRNAQSEKVEHGHDGVDPHVWLDPHNVIQWSQNAAAVMGILDPQHTEGYHTNADAYIAQLEDLIDYAEAQTVQIPQEKRKLVITHDSLRYFAQRFSFDVVGTVITGRSTLAEPSAGELADLIAAMEAAGVCTVFVESTVNRTLAETVAGELGSCEDVRIIELYTGSLGPEDTAADSYIGMMRTNVGAIIHGLTG